MLIYHYSSNLFKDLRTRAKVGGLSNTQIDDANKTAVYRQMPGSYNDHISFFFDRIPLDIIGELYGKENPVWYTGNTIKEYIVNTEDLEFNILYHLVETPSVVRLLDSTSDSDWDNESFKIKYFKQKKDLQQANHERGRGVDNLNKQIAKYKNQTRDYYLRASKRSDFKDNITKYAANVPHVMLYPSSGIIKYTNVETVTIGETSGVNNPVNGMQRADIIREYNLFLEKYPKIKRDQFVLGAGGACLMLGLRETTEDMDMDLYVPLYNILKSSNKYKQHNFNGVTVVEWNDYIDLHPLKLGETVIIDNVYCYSPRRLLAFKLSLNRPKDQDDITKLKKILKIT